MPVVELRGAIPLGLWYYHLPAWEVYFWSVLGNCLPMYFIIKLLDPLTKLLFKVSPFLHGHLLRYFEKIHTKHSEKYNRWGGIFLALFVAIPLPGTGGYTGAALAYLFNLPLKIALPSLYLGIAGSAVLTTFIGVGSLKLWQFFF